MYQFKSTLILFIYILCCSALLIKSLKDQHIAKDYSKQNTTLDIAHKFQDVTYYQLEKDQKKSKLQASHLTANQTLITAKNPFGYVYDESGKKINFSSHYAQYTKKKSLLDLSGDVELINLQAKVQCKKAKLYTLKQFAECSGDVRTNITQLENGDKIFIVSNTLKMWLQTKKLSFFGNVDGQIKRKFSYEPGIKFSSNKLIVDSNELKAQLEEDVKFDFEGIKSRSGRADIFLDNYNKKLKYYVLYDDIEIEQKVQSRDGEFFTRRAYSEVVEAFNLERKVVLKGAPKVSQGSDMTRGYKITLYLDREIMEVDNSSSILKIKQ